MNKTYSAICYIISGIIILILVFTLTSCNSVKRVLKDPAKKEIVGREWEKINPCNNDSIFVTKRDTTLLLDTLYNIYYDTVEVNNEPIVITKRVPTLITKTVTIRDTVRIATVDNRRLNIAIDSVNYYKWLSQQFKAKFEQQIVETKEQRARGNKWILFFIILAAVSLLSHYFRGRF